MKKKTKKRQEKKYSPSDYIRLEDAFKELRIVFGFFAESDLAFCISDGWALVPDDREDAVFYHDQDAFAFDKDGNLADDMAVAHQGDTNTALAVLINYGLDATWDGNPDRRIIIRPRSVKK